MLIRRLIPTLQSRVDSSSRKIIAATVNGGGGGGTYTPSSRVFVVLNDFRQKFKGT